jgi:D-serine deaminase-like pyridoxal phosphate-dependent protein
MAETGLTLQELDTPALVIDLDIMERNIASMAEYCRARGVRLRPHIKTHKVPEIARIQLAAGAVGVTVAKLGEAEVMADAGVRDLFVANQIIGEAKLKRLVALARRCTVTVLADSAEGIRQLGEAVLAAGLRLDVCLELNIAHPEGREGRCGAPPGPEAIRLAQAIHEHPALSFAGILGFRGIPRLFSRDAPAPGMEELRETGREEGRLLTEFAALLEANGIPCPQVIGGSTPTACFVADVPGITEVHPGEYVFSGGTHVGMGMSSVDGCALSVVTTVISRPHPDRAVVDGGSKTFAGDMHPALVPNLKLSGFGLIAALNGPYALPGLLPGAELAALNEEHGMIRLGSDAARAAAVGTRLRIIPNHVCPVVNLFDRVYAVRGERVEQVWTIAARGKLT